MKLNTVITTRGAENAAETRTILGPFEPDLDHTSVGKWSKCRFVYHALRMYANMPLHSERFFYCRFSPLAGLRTIGGGPS